MKTDRLRTIARIALWISAAGSLGMMFYSSRHNPSILLRVLFGVWVLYPFAILDWASLARSAWPPATRLILSWLTIVIAVGSLAAYSQVAFLPPGINTTRVFIVVPPVAGLLTASALGLSGLIARRRARRAGATAAQ